MNRSLASAAADSSASASVAGRIRLEDGIRLLAEPFARIVSEALRRGFLLGEDDAAADLVGIPAREERDVGLLAGVKDRVDVTRENMAVEIRREPRLGLERDLEQLIA